MSPRGLFPVVASLCFLVAAASAQAATKHVFFQQSARVAPRFLDQIGFIPIAGIQPKGSPPATFKSGSTTYKITWLNSLTGAGSTSAGLKLMRNEARYGPVSEGLFADRRLTAAERRRFQVLVDLARDADVLVVHRENPVCASGLTRAQVRGIAKGTITRWSQVATLPAGQPDAITRRLAGSEGFPQPRLGLAARKISGKFVKPDGGLSLIRAGDRSVASVVAWSRTRGDSRLCAVPIDGIAPTNANVHSLHYPEAYPVSFVMHRKRPKQAEPRAQVAAYVAFLKSAAAAKLFRNTGVLLTAEAPPAEPGPAGGPGSDSGSGSGSGSAPASTPGPSSDHQGRPINPVRDDAAARSALTGVRLQRETQTFAFDADRALFQVDRSADGQTCARTAGQWDVLAGWHYAENGGGTIARVHFTLAASRDVTIELPGDTPAAGYIDGQAYTSDPGLSNACF